jgi:hypothetical protein
MLLSPRLSNLLVGLVPGRPEVFAELREIYADDVVFRDPIQEVRGLPAFVEMNERLLGRMRSLAWEIRGGWDGEGSAVIEWTMRGRPKLGPEFAVEGTSRVRAREGRVYDHRDYWDLGELFASGLPGGDRVLRALLRPFA